MTGAVLAGFVVALLLIEAVPIWRARLRRRQEAKRLGREGLARLVQHGTITRADPKKEGSWPRR